MAVTAGTLGSWGTISLELPDFLEDLRGDLNTLAELQITFLDIALSALRLAKAFTTSVLDPVTAIIKAIIKSIKQLLHDFTQLGLYITHDVSLLMAQFPPDDCKGGFAGYEGRMIGRLTDRSDPTRPDISADTPVLAGFFYTSKDASAIDKLIADVKKILALFSVKLFPEGSLPVPVVDRVDYGNTAGGVFGGLSSLGTFSGTPPSKAKVTWRTPDPSRKGSSHPLSAFVGPTGYIVTVSTLPGGIPIWFDRPEKDSGSAKASRGTGNQQQTRETGQCRDVNGKPIVIHGGVQEIDFPQASLGWNNAIKSNGALKDGVARCFGSLQGTDGQNAIIPLGDLQNGSTQYFQRRFTVPLSSVAWQWATNEFSIVLDIKDLPHHAEVTMDKDGKALLTGKGQPSTYYVRVASCSDDVADGTTPYVWDFAGAAIGGDNPGVPFRVNLKAGTPESISAYSASEKITIPNANTVKFLEAVQAALCVMVLSRADLPVIDELEETKGKQFIADAKNHEILVKDVALIRTGMEPYAKKLINLMFPDFAQTITQKGGNQMDFRVELARQAELLANRLRDTAGFSSDFEALVAKDSENLRTATWGKILGDSTVAEDEAATTINRFSKDTIMDSLRGVKRSPTLAEQSAFEAEVKELTLSLESAAAAQAAVEPVTGLTTAQLQKALAATKARLKKMEKKPPTAAGPSFGLAQNPYCIGVPVEGVEGLMGIPDMVRFRKGHFIEYSPLADATQVFSPVIPAALVADMQRSAPPSVNGVYDQYRMPDGSIEVPPKTAALMKIQQAAKPKVGSADLSPVFHVGVDKMLVAAANPAVARASLAKDPKAFDDAGILYVRSVLGAYKSGILHQEATSVLQMVGSALLRPAEDGEWIAIRLFDAFPGLGDFFNGVENWLAQVEAAVQSMADTLIAYIEFVEARLVELQQLIRRTNALIQSILGFSLTLPNFSGLMLLAKGTSGVVSGLVNAQEKPKDSPLAYGAGICFVMALVPGISPIAGSFLQDLIICKAGTSGIAGTPTTGSQIIDVTVDDDPFGLAGIPDPGPAPGPNDEPDTL